MPVFVLVITTVAPTTAAPVWSVTTPSMLAPIWPQPFTLQKRRKQDSSVIGASSWRRSWQFPRRKVIFVPRNALASSFGGSYNARLLGQLRPISSECKNYLGELQKSFETSCKNLN